MSDPHAERALAMSPQWRQVRARITKRIEELRTSLEIDSDATTTATTRGQIIALRGLIEDVERPIQTREPKSESGPLY